MHHASISLGENINLTLHHFLGFIETNYANNYPLLHLSTVLVLVNVHLTAA